MTLNLVILNLFKETWKYQGNTCYSILHWNLTNLQWNAILRDPIVKQQENLDNYYAPFTNMV